MFTESSHVFCLFLTQQYTVTASFVIFDVPMAAATSRDGKTVAAVDWCGFGCVGFALDS